MFQKRWTDQQLIEAMSGKSASREKATRYLLKQYISYIPKAQKKLGLSREDCLDAFTDAVMSLGEQLANGQFRGESKVSTYLYQIFYFKARDLFKKQTTNKVQYLAEPPEMMDKGPSIEEQKIIQSQIQLIKAHLQKIGDPCQQILMDWGYWGYSMAEIAQRVGLASADQAKKKKYKCLQQVRKLIASSTNKA